MGTIRFRALFHGYSLRIELLCFSSTGLVDMRLSSRPHSRHESVRIAKPANSLRIGVDMNWSVFPSSMMHSATSYPHPLHTRRSLISKSQSSFLICGTFCGEGGFFRDSSVAVAPLGRVRSSRFRILAKHRFAFRIPLAICSSISLLSRKIKAPFRAPILRRGRDSNPRCPCGHSSFQDWCVQPLCHLSVCYLYSASASWRISIYGSVAILAESGTSENPRSMIGFGSLETWLSWSKAPHC